MPVVKRDAPGDLAQKELVPGTKEVNPFPPSGSTVGISDGTPGTTSGGVRLTDLSNQGGLLPGLPVDLSPVADLQDENDKLAVPEIADEPVVSHAVAPVSGPSPSHGHPKVSGRVRCCGNAVVHVVHNPGRSRPRQLLQLVLSRLGVVNHPGQDDTSGSAD